MIVDFEGKQYDFPDDASPEEVSKALASLTATPETIDPTAMISRAPVNRPPFCCAEYR